jgi:hypothetical protein
MIHNWAHYYLGRKCEGYELLRPVVSIWILEGDQFRDGEWFHAFSLRDEGTGLELADEELIVTIELVAWSRAANRVEGRAEGERSRAIEDAFVHPGAPSRQTARRAGELARKPWIIGFRNVRCFVKRCVFVSNIYKNTKI